MVSNTALEGGVEASSGGYGWTGERWRLGCRDGKGRAGGASCTPYRVQRARAVDLVIASEVRRERRVAPAGPGFSARLAVRAREVGRHEAGDAARWGVAGLGLALARHETVPIV